MSEGLPYAIVLTPEESSAMKEVCRGESFQVVLDLLKRSREGAVERVKDLAAKALFNPAFRDQAIVAHGQAGNFTNLIALMEEYRNGKV